MRAITNRRNFLAMILIVACTTFSAAATANGATINVFAAASLTDSLKEIGTAYEKETGDKVVFNFGASSLLARQIEEGAPADIFFSADEAKMDVLETKRLLFPDTRKRLLANSLVIVVANDSALEISAAAHLKKVKRLALAETKTVPAGIYAKEYLTTEGLWDDVKSKVIPTDNVRAALAAVESGNVDAGIVYKTDAAISKKVKVTYQVPAAKTPNISYPVAVVKEAKNPAAAKRFAEHLSSPNSQKVFESFGFIVQK